MSEKRFSIVVPFKNISEGGGEEFLKALSNNKGIDQFELIFVFNDKNLKIQDTKHKISRFIKQDFTILQDKEDDSGPSRCWCAGLKVAKGEYVCFLAADLVLDRDWCLSVLKNINFESNKKFFIGNIFHSLKKDKYNYLERVEMQIDRRRYRELIVDFRNFIGEKKALLEIINNFFNNKYFTDIELDFILKNRFKINPVPLEDLVVYNKYPASFIESAKRKFKHGVGDGRICRMFIDKFRKVHTAGVYDFYLGVIILFNETIRAKLSAFDRLILALFNIIFLTGMLCGIIMPRIFIKKYYTFHFDEKQ